MYEKCPPALGTIRTHGVSGTTIEAKQPGSRYRIPSLLVCVGARNKDDVVGNCTNFVPTFRKKNSVCAFLWPRFSSRYALMVLQGEVNVLQLCLANLQANPNDILLTDHKTGSRGSGYTNLLSSTPWNNDLLRRYYLRSIEGPDVPPPQFAYSPCRLTNFGICRQINDVSRRDRPPRCSPVPAEPSPSYQPQRRAGRHQDMGAGLVQGHAVLPRKP